LCDVGTFLSRVVTDDESWIYAYDPLDKAIILPKEKLKLTVTERGQTCE
jgi:hypothetical protein